MVFFIKLWVELLEEGAHSNKVPVSSFPLKNTI